MKIANPLPIIAGVFGVMCAGVITILMICGIFGAYLLSRQWVLLAGAIVIAAMILARA